MEEKQQQVMFSQVSGHKVGYLPAAVVLKIMDIFQYKTLNRYKCTFGYTIGTVNCDNSPAFCHMLDFSNCI